jgi:DNA-binding LacI/PurR family transcriptional regulator
MNEHDLPMIEARGGSATSREAQGYGATLDLIDDDVPFDAIFAASDGLAVGALQALSRCGRRIPEDVAVVGFDGIGSASFTVPPAEHDGAGRRHGGQTSRRGDPDDDG